MPPSSGQQSVYCSHAAWHETVTDWRTSTIARAQSQGEGHSRTLVGRTTLDDGRAVSFDGYGVGWVEGSIAGQWGCGEKHKLSTR